MKVNVKITKKDLKIRKDWNILRRDIDFEVGKTYALEVENRFAILYEEA
jgi:hypothetical protein